MTDEAMRALAEAATEAAFEQDMAHNPSEKAYHEGRVDAYHDAFNILSAALSAPAGLDVHLHEWCRETGSTALLCLGCGSVLDHGAVKPAASLREFLVQQRDGCSCGEGGRTEP